jgi:hypothetical protein
MSGRILIGETIVTAARLVSDRRGELFRVGLVLILGIFAIGVFALNYVLPLLQVQVPQVGGAAAGQPMLDPRFFPAVLFMLVVEFLLIAVFAVGWHRLILLGRQASSGLGVAFGRREIAFLGRLWLCFIGMLLVSIAFSVLEYLLAGMLGADPNGFVLIAMAGYTLIAIYVIGRIGPSFAALSVDQPLGLGAAWQTTRGEGSRIFVIYLLVSLGWFAVAFLFSSIAQILGLGEAAPYALLFINAVLSAGFLALLVTINSILFRQLSGWRPTGSLLASV